MKGFHCLNIPSSWSLSLLNPQCFFVWVLLCAPLIMKCKSFLHQTMGQRGVWPHGIALYQKTSGEIQHKTVQRHEHRFKETTGWEAKLINNESITWCTDMECQLHNRSMKAARALHADGKQLKKIGVDSNPNKTMLEFQCFNDWKMGFISPYTIFQHVLMQKHTDIGKKKEKKRKAWSLKSLLFLTFPVSGGAYSPISSQHE